MAIRAKDEKSAKAAAGDLEPKVHALIGSMENASIAALASDFSDTSRKQGTLLYSSVPLSRTFFTLKFGKSPA